MLVTRERVAQLAALVVIVGAAVAGSWSTVAMLVQLIHDTVAMILGATLSVV